MGGGRDGLPVVPLGVYTIESTPDEGGSWDRNCDAASFFEEPLNRLSGNGFSILLACLA